MTGYAVAPVKDFHHYRLAGVDALVHQPIQHSRPGASEFDGVVVGDFKAVPFGLCIGQRGKRQPRGPLMGRPFLRSTSGQLLKRPLIQGLQPRAEIGVGLGPVGEMGIAHRGVDPRLDPLDVLFPSRGPERGGKDDRSVVVCTFGIGGIQTGIVSASSADGVFRLYYCLRR